MMSDEPRVCWSERFARGGEPSATIVLDAALTVMGAGLTVQTALTCARDWSDEQPCPHCGKVASERTWALYPLDSETADFLSVDARHPWIDADMVRDGKLRWYEEHGCFRWTIEAECIVCRGDIDVHHCEACDGEGKFVEGEGFEPDQSLPPARFRRVLER